MSLSSDGAPVLVMEDLSVSLGGRDILHGISLRLRRGGILSLVGASGSGKSTLLLALMGLLPDGGDITSGQMFLNGKKLTPARMEHEAVRGRQMALLFQDPGSCFNPIRKIGKQYRDCLAREGLGSRWKETAEAALLSAGLAEPDKILQSYAFQLSGGQRQRAAAAMVLSLHPGVILADEPTSALDTVSALRLLNLLKEQCRRGSALLFVTHNIRAAAYLGGYLMIMKNGILIEEGRGEELIRNPASPYTRELLDAVPRLR